MSEARPIQLYIDADACPVKAEAYRVAERHGLKVFVVANSFMQHPQGAEFNPVTDWIAERVGRGDVVITTDVPLADRCIKAGADVIAPSGKPFTPDSIGMALATRNLMSDLRSAGEQTRGPPPFSPKQRSAFLAALDIAVVRLKRAGFVTRAG